MVCSELWTGFLVHEPYSPELLANSYATSAADLQIIGSEAEMNHLTLQALQSGSLCAHWYHVLARICPAKPEIASRSNIF